MNVAFWVRALPLCAIAACASTSPDPPLVEPPDGTFTVDWTINGGTDPDKCNQSLVASIEIVVTDVIGNPAGTYEQACETFATSIPLPPGNYTATATLIDSNGQPRTTSVAIDDFDIVGNAELTTPIDFPASSFE